MKFVKHLWKFGFSQIFLILIQDAYVNRRPGNSQQQRRQHHACTHTFTYLHLTRAHTHILTHSHTYTFTRSHSHAHALSRIRRHTNNQQRSAQKSGFVHKCRAVTSRVPHVSRSPPRQRYSLHIVIPECTTSRDPSNTDILRKQLRAVHGRNVHVLADTP